MTLLTFKLPVHYSLVMKCVMFACCLVCYHYSFHFKFHNTQKWNNSQYLLGGLKINFCTDYTSSIIIYFAEESSAFLLLFPGNCKQKLLAVCLFRFAFYHDLMCIIKFNVLKLKPLPA